MMLLTDGRVLTSEVNGLGMTPNLIERRLAPAGVKAVLAKALGSGLFTNGPCCGSEVFPGEGRNARRLASYPAGASLRCGEQGASHRATRRLRWWTFAQSDP